MQAEVTQKFELLDQRIERVANDGRARSDDAEALGRQLQEQAQVKLRLRATAHAFQEGEHGFGGGRGGSRR